jgi:hypothetical protein
VAPSHPPHLYSGTALCFFYKMLFFMKKNLFLLPFFGFLLSAFFVFGQKKYTHHALKIDLVGPAHSTWSGAYEYRLNARNGFELGVHWRTFEPPTDVPLFNGDLINYYEIERRTDYSYTVAFMPFSTTQEQFVGTNRPFPPSPEYVALRNLRFSLGYRFWLEFRGRKSRWQWFLQPGLSASQYRFFTVRQNIAQLYTSTTEIEVVEYPFTTSSVTTNTAYAQTRSMRQLERWVYGLNYDVGVTRRLGKGHRWQIEARATAIYNPDIPHETPLPQPVRTAQLRGQLHLTCSLGRLRLR